MRLFKTKRFSKWARKQGVSDLALKALVSELESGLLGVGLGGPLFKKRLSLGSYGKSRGARTILAYKAEEKVFFIFGFNKSVSSNVSQEELSALKKFAKQLCEYTECELSVALDARDIEEVSNG